MRMKRKILFLLSLLLTAVTQGTWAQTGIVNGSFSVSATKSVCFSHGNLQATYDGSSWTWAFAANQWDYIGNATANNAINGNGTVSANGTVDLFGWVGASNTTWTDAAMYGISNSTLRNNTATYGNKTNEALKSDWGKIIDPTGKTWRTLTNAEMTYVFNTRSSGSTVWNTANARYTFATINTDDTGVNGIILFPDGITVEESEVSTAGTVNAASSWGTQCTAAQWAALEAKGCVFLPAAGYRSGASFTSGNHGCYWTSNAHASNTNDAFRLYFLANQINLGA